MSINKQTYQLGKIKKLIDLNGDLTNFDINFRVTSKDNKPFEMLVLDQTTLDNNPQLEYKKVISGQISGNLVNDKNVYQNYFLILKSEEEVIVDVEIEKKELPKVITPPIIPQIEKSQINDTIKSSKRYIYLLLFIGLGFLIYYIYSKNKENVDDIVENGEEPFISYCNSPKGSPVLNISKNNNLFERLKKLKI